MRNFFQKIPFLRITGLFMAGIFISRIPGINNHLLALLITSLLSLQLFWWYSGNFSLVQVQNLSITLLLVLSGVFYPEVKGSRTLPEFAQNEYFLAELRQKPVEKAKSYQTILQVQNRRLKAPETVLAYFSKSSFDSTLNIGDQLVILAKPERIVNRNNPFEFDYQSFVNKNGIWFSVYLPEGTWLKTGRSVSRLTDISEHVRQQFLQVLSHQVRNKEERSVIEALTLGYRNELDRETKNYFASTGAMHVLAVSGLHVGLIYFILNILFSGIKSNKTGRTFYPVILLSTLWAYAFLTGFSPSVQRATVMFSFVIIGEAIRRPVSIFNSLSASALVLMLIHPEVIFEVGFQLSYLAVAGIVLIQPKLAALISVKNKILKAIWDLFTVSVAAQLATFPLGLFYFNQTSNLFWASNFIVIPAATALMWLTFLFFIFGFVPALSHLLALVLTWITHLMILSLKYLSELPYAVTDGIVITSLQTWLLYGILAALLAFFFSKQKQWLFVSLIVLLSFQILEIRNNMKLFDQQAVFVYNSPTRLIHLINGRKNYVITTRDDSLSAIDSEMVKRVQDHLKLDQPFVISAKSLAVNPTSDMCIVHNEIYFLNCRISLPENPKQKELAVWIFRKSDSQHPGKASDPAGVQRLIFPSDSACYVALSRQ